MRKLEGVKKGCMWVGVNPQLGMGVSPKGETSMTFKYCICKN